MPETFFLCLLYNAESSSYKKSSREPIQFESVDLLKIANEEEDWEVVDIMNKTPSRMSSSSHRPSLQWIEILSGMYWADEDKEVSTMAFPFANRNPQKKRSLRSNHSFEKGESSRSLSFSHRPTESSYAESSSSSQATTLVGTDNNVRLDRTDPVSSNSQISIYSDIGDKDDVELGVLVRRAVRLSLADSGLERGAAELSDEPVKGKQPIRPAVMNVSMTNKRIDRSGQPNQLSDKGKQPLRSALRESLSSSIISNNQHEDAYPTRSKQSDSETTKGVADPESGQHGGCSREDHPDIEQETKAEKDTTKGQQAQGSESADDDSSQSQEEYEASEGCNLDDNELNELLDAILNTHTASTVRVRPYTSPATGQDVFLFNHGIVIPRNAAGKLAYGVAIPGKIFRRKKDQYPSTSAFLMALGKEYLDDLGIGTARAQTIRILILDDAEEAYRKAKYGNRTWLGIIKERKNRYDPETRQWKSIFYPSQWRRHGLVLPEGQRPPENSCKFRMVTLCGQVLHQWYVRCDKKRAFGPRDIIVKISCGQGDRCEKSLSWEPEDGPLTHENSVTRWTEIDPDKEGATLYKKFYPFMKSWMIEGAPKEEPPPGCLKINCVTKCGFVKSRIRLLCHRHIFKNPKCIGGEFTMLIDRGCGSRDDIHRCDEKTVCEGYLDWIRANLGLPVDKLSLKQVDELKKLHATLNSAYKQETKGMGSFLKHQHSEKKWKDVIYNHVEMYNMLFDWGLRTIHYPEGLSVVRAENFVG